MVVFEGVRMLCFLLINFTEDIEIDGMLVIYFFIDSYDHRPQYTNSDDTHKTHQSLLITISIGDDDAGH